MEEKKVFKEGRRIPLIIGAFAIMIMLTLGVGIAHFQNADVARNIMSEPSNGCGILFTGDEEYCPIASGAQYVIDGIISGELTFSELQAYVDAAASGGETASQYQASFDAMPLGDISIAIDIDQSIDDISRREIGQGYDVTDRLLERLPEAELYCDEPPGVPSDWQFNPTAICLSIGMTGIVGVAMATGIVSAFYALFGAGAWVLGLTKWTLTMEGFGLVPNAIQAGILLYESCMDIFDGEQTG